MFQGIIKVPLRENSMWSPTLSCKPVLILEMLIFSSITTTYLVLKE